MTKYIALQNTSTKNGLIKQGATVESNQDLASIYPFVFKLHPCEKVAFEKAVPQEAVIEEAKPEVEAANQAAPQEAVIEEAKPEVDADNQAAPQEAVIEEAKPEVDADNQAAPQKVKNSKSK